MDFDAVGVLVGFGGVGGGDADFGVDDDVLLRMGMDDDVAELVFERDALGGLDSDGFIEIAEVFFSQEVIAGEGVQGEGE